MKKDDAKTILSNMYEEVLTHIDHAHDAHISEALVIDFLHDLANALVKNDFKNPFDLYLLQQLTFEEEYKLLAKQSLDSYSSTNEIVAELSKEQQETLDDLHTSKIDISALSDRFASIQSHLQNEVEQANKTIASLIKRVQNLEAKASIDPLTKVYNRRALDDHLSTVITHKHQHPLSMFLLMIDIDDFKKINDTYGHIAGDKVLIFIANMLKKTLRDGDKIFRYGGEEFVIVLNRIALDGCELVAERLLELVRSGKLISKDGQISVTMSIGATQFRAEDTIETLVTRADKALYLAKNSGKDQLKVSP